MPCLDRRDLNPDEWYWLLEVHQGPVWLPCEIRKRLIRLDLISESRRPTLTGVPNFDTWSSKFLDFVSLAPMISIGWA